MQPSQPYHRSRIGLIIRISLSISVLLLALGILLYKQTVVDWITVWQFQPSSEVATLADRSSMSDHGRFYLYASQAQIDDRTAFNAHCASLVEKTTVLGCYAANRIYIYDVRDERLSGVKEVTAAHEMLHAAYQRLSQKEKQRINQLVEQAATGVNDEKLAARLALYDKTEPGERLNELHSILGTEMAQLPEPLEAHYRQYFVDRQKVVALSAAYEAVFTALEQQQRSLVAELNQLSLAIERRGLAYRDEVKQLQTDIVLFNQTARNGGFASSSVFTAERSRLTGRQTQLEADRQVINADIASYQAKKTELDTLNLQAEGLQQSLDSTALPPLPEAPSL